MNWSECREAVRDAKLTIEAADRNINEMALIIKGRLRAGHVAGSTLDALKRELRDWDIHRSKWKESP